MAEVYELVESTGLRGLLVAIDNLGGNDHLPPELNFLPWHAVRYAYEHPKAAERERERERERESEREGERETCNMREIIAYGFT